MDSLPRAKVLEMKMKHLEIFQSELDSMRKSKELADFNILIGETVIPTHRLILAANSKYFRTMLSGQNIEASKNQVDLKGISVPTMNAILDYCYTRNIDLNESNIEDVLLASSKLIIDSLLDLCIEFILSKLNLSNCLIIADLSERCNLNTLHKSAMAFCLEKFESLVKEPEFLELDEHILTKLVKDDELNIAEKDLPYSLMEWTKKDIAKRRPVFDTLVEHIRFTSIDPVSLIELSNTEFIQASPKCLALIDRAKNYHLLKAYSESKYKLTALHLPPRNNLMSRQRIFAIGGWARFQALSKVEFYDPYLDSWTEVKPMLEKRGGLGCAMYEDSIYAVGGHNGINYLATVERYDTTKDQWFNDVPDMSSARTSIGVVVLDGFLYTIGGEMQSGATDKVEKYSIREHTWKKCASLNQKRLGAGVAVVNGYIYVVGGVEAPGSPVFDSVEKYDPTIDKWTYVAPIGTARKHFACASYDNKIYALGGRKVGGELDAAEVYDTSKDTWTKLPNMQMKRHGISAVELGGMIYAIGGQSDDADLNKVEVFDPNKKEWSWKQSTISERLGCGVTIHPVRKQPC